MENESNLRSFSEETIEAKDHFTTPPNRLSAAFENVKDDIEIELSTPKCTKTKNFTPATFKIQKNTTSALVDSSPAMSPSSVSYVYSIFSFVILLKNLLLGIIINRSLFYLLAATIFLQNSK